VCNTYPKQFVVPRFFSDEEIKDACVYRTKNRLPSNIKNIISVLSYHYKKNKCCLWRCSQNKSGITQQRSGSDEKLLRMISEYSGKLIIFDARPYLNAFANKVIKNLYSV
jgi:hypothetical protein